MAKSSPACGMCNLIINYASCFPQILKAETKGSVLPCSTSFLLNCPCKLTVEHTIHHRELQTNSCFAVYLKFNVQEFLRDNEIVAKMVSVDKM